MTKAMRHPADHDPDRFFYVLFVEGKGYVSNYSAWRTGKEFLQFEEKVERASFWDDEDSTVQAMAACRSPGGITSGKVAVHYTRRNSKGVEDLDKNPIPEPPSTLPGGWSTFLELKNLVEVFIRAEGMWGYALADILDNRTFVTIRFFNLHGSPYPEGFERRALDFLSVGRPFGMRVVVQT